MPTQGRRNSATEDNHKPHQCKRCKEDCDILVMAAVSETTRIWKCPVMLGTDYMDRAVALALIRAALEVSFCIVVRIRDLGPEVA